MRLFSLTVTLLASFLVSAAAFAADIEVKMLNKGEEGKMIFEPSFIQAQVGCVDKRINPRGGKKVQE